MAHSLTTLLAQSLEPCFRSTAIVDRRLVSSDSHAEILSLALMGLGGASFGGCDPVIRMEHFEQEDGNSFLHHL